MLTSRAQTIPDTDATNYHHVNMFMTKEVLPVCKSDTTKKDSQGNTCTDAYDFDSSNCGKFDTELFNSSRDCCGCQGSNGAQSVNFLTPMTMCSGDTGMYTASGDSRLKSHDWFVENDKLIQVQGKKKDKCFDKC